MEITYELEPNDISALFRYVWHTQTRMPLAQVLSLLFLFAAIDLAVPLGGLGNHFNTIEWLGFGLINVGAVITLVTHVIYPWLLKRKVLKDPQSLGQRQIRVSATEFYAKYPLSETILKWQAMFDVVEDTDYIYIFLKKGYGWIIPKRAFANAEQAKQFADTAKSYWQTAKSMPVGSQDVDTTVWPPAPSVANSQEPDSHP